MLYWIAAFVSAAAVGTGGMFYLRHYFREKEVKVPEKRKKLFYAGAALFYAATAALMAAFTSPGDSTVFVFSRDIVLLHCLFYIAAIDLKLKLIPNRALLAMLIGWAVLTAGQIIAEGWSAGILIDAAFGCIAAGGIFFIGNLISRNGMGMGDVKLMAVSGLYLGFNKVMGLVFWALLLAVIAGISLMAAKKAKIKTAIPLAPFFLCGAVVSNALYIISGLSEV